MESAKGSQSEEIQDKVETSEAYFIVGMLKFKHALPYLTYRPAKADGGDRLVEEGRQFPIRLSGAGCRVPGILSMLHGGLF